MCLLVYDICNKLVSLMRKFVFRSSLLFRILPECSEIAHFVVIGGVCRCVSIACHSVVKPKNQLTYDVNKELLRTVLITERSLPGIFSPAH